MTNHFNFNDGPLPPSNECEPHMPVGILIDNSGSLAYQNAIRNIEKAVNRFADDICKDPKAAERVDICVMTFNDTAQVVQDWCPITEMKKVTLSAGGGTNMSAGLKMAVEKLKERGHLYEHMGITVRMPYLIILTDGMGDDIDVIAEEIRERARKKKMYTWFLGVAGYDKATAAKLTEGRRVFELTEEAGYDFTDFFHVMEVSIKAVSTSAPGERPVIKEEENPLNKEDCGVRVANIDDWLS